ncbi:MAG: thiamine pyrophosphate-binding protein [Deltaproteobacteria bacterium]|nr:thiamine pyrophosphate-binding protein [Deltaproteobacteria bacterium]
MQMSGGEAIARMLKNEGVEKVFGIIDGTYFGFYSNLEKYGIELITPRHETCAAHMAGAYARLTGKLGVCMASNGPGVANILPGVAVENSEGNRVMVITSARRHRIINPDRGGTYQSFEQTKVIGAMAKYSETVPSFDRTVEITRQAFRRAWQGRPGVTHLNVPEDIMNGKSDFDESDFPAPARYRATEPLYPSDEQVEKTAQMLIEAEFPIIHAGSGIIHTLAFEELEQVMNLLQAPVTTSWAARGALAETNDLAIPMIYIDLNNEVRNAADLVLVLGSRLGETDWWGKAPYWADPSKQKMIQVDIDGDYLGRSNKPLTLAVQADVKVFLRKLGDKLRARVNEIPATARKNILNKFLSKKEKAREKLDEQLQDISAPMNSAHIAHVCQQVFDKDSVAIFDGGNAAVWGQMFSQMKAPNTGMSTPKLGMLGAGVSQALGAAVAKPNRQVYCIIGDGAMGFHPQEIETAVRNGLNVIYLVVCDKQWGMVKMNQSFQLRPIKTMIKKSLDPDENINADFSEIRFDRLAESMGAYGERVGDPKELKPAIERCIAQKRPCVIHVDVDPVKHMWAPGLLHFKKMHEEPKGS